MGPFHTPRINEGEVSFYKEITQDESLELQSTGYYVIGNTKIVGIRRNSTTYKTNTHKSPSLEPVITTETVMEDHIPIRTHNGVVADWVEIKLSDYFAEVHLESNKIKLRSGVSC